MFSLRAGAAVWLLASALIGPGCRFGYDEVSDAGADGDASMDAGMPDRDAMVDRDATVGMDATVDRDATIDMDATSMDAMPGDGGDAGLDAEVGFLASTASLGRAFENNCMVADGALFCWGSNKNGLLGQGIADAGAQELSPLQITVPAVRWQAVCGGEHHACALSDAGEIYCWGSNADGQLGAPSVADSDVPLLIDGTAGFTQISCVGAFTCALQPEFAADPESGLIYCWGSNEEGSLGVELPGDPRPAYLSAPTPVRLTDPSLRFKSVSAGDAHACALTVDGELYCWGRNSQGQMGNNLDLTDTSNWRQRFPIKIGSDTWLAVSAGQKVTCGVQTDQHLYCWGGVETDDGMGGVNEGARNGEVGNGTLMGVREPVQIGTEGVGGATRTWRTVVTSIRTHECALTTEDEVYCWGLGEDGQLGDGHSDESGYSNPIPTLVESDDGVNDEWEQIGTGGTYACGLRHDHSLWCWGKNQFGTLGVGSSEWWFSKPTRVILPEPEGL